MTQRYDTYKESGVQWLGEIPRHWEMRKMKYIFDERSEKNHPDEPMLSATQSEGVILQSKYQGRVVVVNTGFDGLKLVKVGDFVIHLRSFQGGIEYAYDQGIISSAYTILNPKYPELSAYYKKLFKSSAFIDLLKICVTGIREGQNINYSKLKQFYIPLPPLPEQRAIVTYLDDKCGKIDKLVEGKQKQIELLAEMKQRIIADAVTRGLNPNVKMKATNIPWLKEIPEHWETHRAKHMFNKEQRPFEEGDEIVTCFRDGEVTLRKNRRTTGFTEATDYSHYQHICKGDLVIHQMDAFAGSAGVSDSDGMGTPVLSVCTPKSENILNEYYAHIVRLMGKNGFILSLYRGIRERSSDFRFDTFAKLWLPVPPLPEQRAIVTYLDDKCGKIDLLVEKLKAEIDAIKEYKQRLISDVVTGQIKVC